MGSHEEKRGSHSLIQPAMVASTHAASHPHLHRSHPQLSPEHGAEEKEHTNRTPPLHHSSSSSFFTSDSPSPSSSSPAYKAGPSPSSESPDSLDVTNRLSALKLRTFDDSSSTSLHTKSFSPTSSTASASSASPLASSASSAFSTPTGAQGSGGGSGGGHLLQAAVDKERDRAELQRPLFPSFDSTWSRPFSSSADPPYSHSPIDQRRHLRPSAVGDGVGGSHSLSPSPHSGPDPHPRSPLDDLDRLLGPLSSVYSVHLIPALTGASSGAFAPPGLSPYLELLRSEGCAFCLGQRDAGDDGRYAVLHCEPLQRRHIAHLSCLLSSLTSPQPGLTPSPASRVPVLDPQPTTVAFRLLAGPAARPPSPSAVEHSGGRRFAIDLCLAHAASNCRQTSVSWPHIAPVYVDAGGLHPYLFLSFTGDDSGGESPCSNASPCSSAPPSPSLAGLTSPANASPAWESTARFLALRGKVVFSCVDVLTQESFEHCLHYDLTQPPPPPPGRAPFLRLVHADAGPQHYNVLTLGVQRSRDGRAYVLSYLRYNLRPAQQRVSYLAEMAQPLRAVPASPLRRGGYGGTGSPLGGGGTAFNPSAPSFVPQSFSSSPVSVDALLTPRLSLQTFDEEGGGPYHPLQSGSHAAQAMSPFSKPRAFGPSAVSSSSASPVPSSRNAHYVGVQSPSHLHHPPPPSLPHALQTGADLRLMKGAKAAGGSPSSLPTRLSPHTLPPGATHSRGGGAYYAGGGSGPGGSPHEWGGDSAYPSPSAGDDFDADDFPADDDDVKAFQDAQTGRPSLAGQSPSHGGVQGNLGYSRRDGGGGGGETTNEQSPLFLPALPTFPSSAPPGLAQVNLGPNPLLNLTVDAVRGAVMRLVKTHAGSRFVQQKLDARDAAFFALFYDEMKDHVPELMVDNFSHFAIEKLIAACSDEQCLQLLQRLAPAIAVVACQKHGSFSVQALVDSLHTPAQVFTLVEAMKADVMRILTHASGHFVVLRMLQRFPYASTKFIDDAICANVGLVATDHHGLRVFKAVLCVRRPVELVRLFKQVARMTMKLVENMYGNYCIQAVLDVAPPGVRTNIKVKMEGKYMRLSKQKFSSNVVEKCLKQSSSHWRSIIIRELTAQPAVAELLRDRYGKSDTSPHTTTHPALPPTAHSPYACYVLVCSSYVLQTGLNVANAQQVQEILRAITPYLPSLRDNVRSKWKKMLKKAGAAVARGGGEDAPHDGEPVSPDPRHMAGGDDGEEGEEGVGAAAAVYGGGGGDVSAVGYGGSQQSPHGGSPAFNYRQLQGSPHGVYGTGGGMGGGGYGGAGGSPLGQQLGGGYGQMQGAMGVAYGAGAGGGGGGYPATGLSPGLGSGAYGGMGQGLQGLGGGGGVIGPSTHATGGYGSAGGGGHYEALQAQHAEMRFARG